MSPTAGAVVLPVTSDCTVAVATQLWTPASVLGRSLTSVPSFVLRL